VNALVVTAVLGCSIVAHADSSVTVTLTPQGQQLAMEFGDSQAQLVQKAIDAINNTFETLRVSQVLQALMTTTAFANSGLGVDYAVKPGEHVVGVVVDGAISNDTSFLTSGHITTGAVVNVNAMAGWNLARRGHPRWTVFANAGYATGSLYVLDGHMFSGGAHVQYRAIDSSAPGAARWLGVDVTSGAEVSRWELGNSAPVVTHFTLHASTGTGSRAVVLTSTGTLSLVATTFTVPVEVTTGVRFGDAFSIYAGGGVDVIAGDSTATMGLNGNMTQESDGTPLGSVVITASGHESPRPLTVHALAGLQLDVSHVHLYLQALVTPDVYGAALGVRVAW
jgi:hypothetical protein